MLGNMCPVHPSGYPVKGLPHSKLDLPWPLASPFGISRGTFIGNPPLRCQRCGNTTPIIGVKHHNRT